MRHEPQSTSNANPVIRRVRDWAHGLQEQAKRFVRCDSGAVGIIFGIVLIPLMIAVGMAVDVGRAYLIKQRLGQAADAAGLAVAASYEEGANMQSVLDEFFDKNYEEGGLSVASTPSYQISGSAVDVTVSADVEMTVMKIIGVSTITVTVTSQTTFSENSMEVVLVLDNTGSMSGSKLTSLQTAATDLVDILLDGTSGNVKIGLVPFTALVNIGSDMDAYASPDPDSSYEWGNDSWWGCVMARTYPADVEDSDVSSGGYWEPFYWEDDGNNNWYYSGRYRADTSPPSSKGPNKYCPNAVTPLTSDEQTLTDAIDDMYAYGPTHVNVGAIWGWRLLSPDEPFTEGGAYGTDGLTKAIILLTDGETTTYSYVKSAYDYPSEQVLGTSSTSAMVDELDDRLSETCTNMKDKDIVVYSITFDVDSSNIQSLMEGCATDEDKYFDSPSEDELKRTFRAIAKELKEIRLSD